MPERRGRAVTRRGDGADRHRPDVAGAPGCRPAGSSSCRVGAPPSCGKRAGPPGAPTVVLLHGWTSTPTSTGSPATGRSPSATASSRSTTGATAAGSAPGAVSRCRDCADDAVALLDVLGDRAGGDRRLLDGRPDRPARVAPPPGPGGRARAVRHGTRLLGRSGRRRHVVPGLWNVGLRRVDVPRTSAAGSWLAW